MSIQNRVRERNHTLCKYCVLDLYRLAFQPALGHIQKPISKNDHFVIYVCLHDTTLFPVDRFCESLYCVFLVDYEKPVVMFKIGQK